MNSFSQTKERVVDLLATLVAVPSLTGEEGPVADTLRGCLRQFGFEANRHDNNLWFTLGEGPRRLLLNSHLDVVPASADHPYPPFEPTVRDGHLFGRGSVDAKASVAAMTMALVELSESGWKPAGGQIVAAFTASEESGWPYNGLQDTLPQLPAIESAVVGEPTSLAPCIAQKGLLILRVTSSGKTAHAARPELGDNAILRAVTDLTDLSSLGLDREHPQLGRVTVTPTVIEGGSARNVVPDRCTFFLDVRSTPAYTHEELTGLISAHLDSKVEVHSDRFVPVDTAPDAKVVLAAQSASPGLPVFGSPTMSDWIFLKGTPTVKLGPGDSRRSHTPGECIDTDELARAVGVYRRLIMNYFEA